MKRTASLILCALPLWAASQSAFPDRFVGDLGAMVTSSSAVVRGADVTASALPYAYGDWGRFYARVDTLGIKMLPLASGHLELAARVSTEGFKSRKTAYPAAEDRSSPLPIGAGTFQRTAVGGIFAYAMHDPQSGGQFAELNWAGQLDLGAVKLYPQLGVQYRSADYVRHLYGVTAAQSVATGLQAYQPGSSLMPMATLHASMPLSGPWSLQLQARYRWLDDAVRQSPLINQTGQVSGLAAVTYTLK